MLESIKMWERVKFKVSLNNESIRIVKNGSSQLKEMAQNRQEKVWDNQEKYSNGKTQVIEIWVIKSNKKNEGKKYVSVLFCIRYQVLNCF